MFYVPHPHLLVSAVSGFLIGFVFVQPEADLGLALDLDCPGCQVTEPSGSGSAFVSIDISGVTEVAGTCKENEESQDPDDCEPNVKCKITGVIQVTNSATPPPDLQLNTPWGSFPLPGGSTGFNVGGNPPGGNCKFACGSDADFSVCRADGEGETIAEWEWKCAACPLSVSSSE